MDERKRKIINEMEQVKESALPENEKEKRISQLAGELGELITEKKKKAAKGKRENG
ncbi:MAG: hypothetical protein K6T88_14575 [Bacillus sp. (in: Bacteria)]|nr:hypothetical protein [Bacillus sp. (in: firmicutes)]